MTDCRHFLSNPTSVSATRDFVAERLASLPVELVERIQLIASELATNCVLHARTEFDVCITRSDDEIRVEVTDASDGLPVLRHPGADEPTGRGLLIAAALSDDWGVTALDPSGTAVWFKVGVP
jgi:anti-sigma regulatory factor (Ser/Thr protein kinase)